jgi:hypothetical protein
MDWNARLWKNSISELTKFLAPLVATLGRSERRLAATRYVEGLLMPVGGGEKGYHFGGEVAPLPREPFGVSLSLFSEVLFRTARSRQGRAVVGRGGANP